MAESDKPFVCHISGCGQKFSNHDHLTTHQQKHDLSLRFRPGENLIVDQTPTPTRFLRIGEKIGLFQELEEAASNPFDQDFKSATDLKSSSQGSEDEEGGRSPRSSEDSRGGLATIPVAPPANLVNPDKPVPMATVPAHINTASALTKQKLLQTIQMKEQQKLLEQTIARQLGVGSGQQELLAQAIKNMIPTSVDNSSPSSGMDQHTFMEPTEIPARRRRGRKPDDEDPEIKRQRFLERNRAAASRCRAKKKVWVDGLESRCKDLEVMKQNLAQEVEVLRSEVKQLKSILIAHKDCPLIVHQRPPPSTSNNTDSHPSAASEVAVSSGGMTLLAQLSTMPSMSALIDSPVPSVGSVVPNMHQQHPLNPSLLMANGLTQQSTPEVAKDVEISDDLEGPLGEP